MKTLHTTYYLLNTNRGQSSLEVLIAITILTLAISAAIVVGFGNQSAVVDSELNNRAIYIARQELEEARATARGSFSSLVSASSTDGIYTKELIIVDIDVNTKDVISRISWKNNLQPGNLELLTRITNWRNPVSGTGGGCSIDILTGDWSNPQLVSSVDIGAGNQGTDVVVSLPYVYVSGVAAAFSKPDIFVIEVSNFSSPSLAGSLDIGSNGINALYVNGDYLYAASDHNTKEFMVFDISDPPNIVEVASINLTQNHDATTIHGIGDTVYVGREEIGDQAELVVIDVTTPNSPSTSTLIEIGDDVNSLFSTSDENRMYLVTENSSLDLWIYDVTTPSLPILIDTYDLQEGGELSAVGLRLPDHVLVGVGEMSIQVFCPFFH